LSYDETHQLTSDARAVVFLVDVTVGPNAGTVVASVAMKDPGALPIPFQLTYPLSAVAAANEYQVFAGIVDGDSAWATPTGTSVPVPRQQVGGVNLELEYRPDLLKGAVTGTISGDGLQPITDPDAYGTSILIEASTGETVGFQMIEPIASDPIPFSAPFNPSTIDQSATYVARGSVWTGTTLWNTPTGVPVITNGNPKSGVVLTVVESSVTTNPTSSLPSWLPWLLLAAAIVVAIIVFAVWRDRRLTVTDGPDGPTTPPPPPGPDSPPPPPGEGAVTSPGAASDDDLTAAPEDEGLGALAGGGANGAGEVRAPEDETRADDPEADGSVRDAPAREDEPPR
jgi:uncharacterized lipoprotein YbaY